MKIVGMRPYKFTPKDGTGEIEGTTVFCTSEDKETNGLMTEKFSISKDKLGTTALKLGAEIEPMYNKYGKVSGVCFK